MRRIFLSVAVILLMFVGTVRGEEVIEDGKTVKFDYTLYVNGQVADTSEGKEPIEYTQGEGMIIKGLESQLVGMKVGDEKKIIVAPEDGYGPINPNGIVEFPKENLVDDVDPVLGMMLQVQTQDGQTLNGIIVDIKDETLTLNFNHPLAGQELTFDVKITEIH